MMELSALLDIFSRSEIIPDQSTAFNEFFRFLQTYPFSRRSSAIAKVIDNKLPLIYTSELLTE